MIVAVSGFYRFDELRRFAKLRTSAIVLGAAALSGVLLLGVLRGLIVTAALCLILVIRRLSRPPVVPVEISRRDAARRASRARCSTPTP